MLETRVLLVEDSETDALLIGLHLRGDARFTVTHVDTLSAAYDSLGNAPPTDVVVLDLNLPDSMGLETFSSLHQRFPNTPVVILSGQDDEEVAVDAVRKGAQDYVPKGSVDAPLLVRSLLYAIERNGRHLAERRNLLVDRELATARKIQQHLLPSHPPSIDGFDIAAICEPAEACGGDFFDFIRIERSVTSLPGEPDTPLPEDRADTTVAWDLLVADVSRHGFAPALIMVGARRVLRTCVQMHDDISECLTIANRAIVEDTLDSQFITMFLCRLDPVCRTLTYAGAGHAATVLHADGNTTDLQSSGLPLGLKADTEYEIGGTVALQSGDFVLLMTDGAFEAISPDQTFFGQQRIFDLIHQHRDQPTAKILDLLLQAIRSFCRPVPLKDDVTAVLIKVT